jgi:bifunctional DNase/RNase
MIELIVDSIRVNTQNYQRVLILKEKNAERSLPIWIGQAEADAIAIKIQGIAKSRPLSHDLMYSIISALTASLDYVLLNDIKGETFYAKIALNSGGKAVEIDCRPSDAIALAVRAGVPIYAEEAVMNESGMILDQETGKPALPTESKEGASEKKVSDDELKRLSAFRDFIDKADLDDLGKNKS